MYRHVHFANIEVVGNAILASLSSFLYRQVHVRHCAVPELNIRTLPTEGLFLYIPPPPRKFWFIIIPVHSF